MQLLTQNFLQPYCCTVSQTI